MKLLFRSYSVLFLCLPFHIVCMESQIQADFFQKIEVIDAKNEENLRSMLTIAQENKDEFDYHKKELEEKLACLQQKIVKKREDRIDDIRKYYDLLAPDSIWLTNNHLAWRYDTFEREYQKEVSLSCVKHDSNIPENFARMIISNFTKRDINPYSINLGLCKDCAYQVSTSHLILNASTDSIEIKEPAFININPSYLQKLSQEEKEAFCMMMVEFTQRDSIFNNAGELHAMIPECAKEPMVFDAEEFHRLKILLLASKNARNAHLIRLFFKKACIAKFSIDDYKMLSDMNNLYQALEIVKDRPFNIISDINSEGRRVIEINDDQYGQFVKFWRKAL